MNYKYFSNIMGLRFYQIKYDHHCQNNSSDHFKKGLFFIDFMLNTL